MPRSGVGHRRPGMGCRCLRPAGAHAHQPAAKPCSVQQYPSADWVARHYSTHGDSIPIVHTDALGCAVADADIGL